MSTAARSPHIEGTTVFSDNKVRDIKAKDRSIGFLIFGFLLACYLFTYTGVIQSSDGLAMFATTESLARRGEADTNQIALDGPAAGRYWFRRQSLQPQRAGHAAAGLAAGLAGTYLGHHRPGAGRATAQPHSDRLDRRTALSYGATTRLEPRASSIIVALIFGLATLAWPYTQTFFSDPVCGWGLFAAAYGLLAYAQTGRKRYLAMAGVAWGFAYLARVINLVTLPIYIIALYLVLESQVRHQMDEFPGWSAVLRYNWRPIISFMAPIVAFGLTSLWWNWMRFGDIFETGYAETERFDALWWFGVAGMLVSPGRGLIWYSPILLLAIPGAVWFWRNERRIFWLITAIFCHLCVALRQMVYVARRPQLGAPFPGADDALPGSLVAGAGWTQMVRRWGMIGPHSGLAPLCHLCGRTVVGHAGTLWACTGMAGNQFSAALCPGDIRSASDTSPLVLQWQFLTPRKHSSGLVAGQPGFRFVQLDRFFGAHRRHHRRSAHDLSTSCSNPKNRAESRRGLIAQLDLRRRSLPDRPGHPHLLPAVLEQR